MEKIRKAKFLLKKDGIFVLAKKLLLYIPSFFFCYSPLVFYSISGSPQKQLQPRCPLQILKGSAEDIPSIMDMQKDLYHASLHERVKYNFDNGGKLFMGFSEGELVSLVWLHYYPGILATYPHVKIGSDEAFIGRCDTKPKFRGKNILPVVLQHVVKHAVGNGKNKCYISTSPRKTSAIRAFEKAGFSFIEKKRAFRVFRKDFNNQLVSS